MLSDQDRRIIRELQNGLPLASRPYKIIGERLKISEDELINRLGYLIENGFVRRLGAVLRHQDLGFQANAMVVWDVPDDRVREAGSIMARFREVTHCYQRPRQTGWPYNLFTMVHGHSRGECARIAGELAQAAGISEYSLLFSTAELKKISMRYFE